MSNIAKGFNCTTCDTFHAFSGYVYAHADVELRHECKVCGAVHIVFALEVEQETAGTIPAKAGQA